MTRTFFAFILLLVTSCTKSSTANHLPEPTGQGAAPMPQLPTLDKNNDTLSTVDVGKTTGITYPIDQSEVGVLQSGVIAKVFVKEGDKVKKGDILFQQDLRDGQLRVDQAQAAVAAAKVALQAAQTDYNRNKTLFEQTAINQMQWERIQTAFDNADVGLKQADVQLKMAQKALSDATVRSPMNGVVAAKLKNAGEMATLMPPTPVVLIQNQTVLELRFKLPEQALALVKKNDIVKAHFSALDVTKEAKVVRISPAVNLQTRTVEYFAEINNADGALHSGLLAEVQVETKANSGEPKL